MKVLKFIIELITAPFSLIFRTSENMKVSMSNLAKPLITFLISVCIVALIIIYIYREYIFK